MIEASKSEKVNTKTVKELHRHTGTEEIIAVTPLLRRARGYNFSSPIQQPVITRDYGRGQSRGRQGGSHTERHLVTLRSKVSPAQYSDYVAIVRNTEVLLRAVGHDANGKGASSLMDMCLRKVPQYITGVKAWEVYDAEQNGTRSKATGADIGPRVYAELESSFAVSDSGWVHLRSVVRAEAFGALSEAIVEGLLPDEVSMSLIELWSGYEPYEIGGFFEIFLNRQYPEPLCAESRFSEDSKLEPLAFLQNIAARTQRPSLLLQGLANALLQGHLPATWLTTREFRAIWTSAYRLISRGHAALAAIDFIATSTTLLSQCQQLTNKQRQPESFTGSSLACQRTYIQVLSVVSAMRRLGEDELRTGNVVITEKVERINRTLKFVLHICLAEINSWRGRRSRPREILCLATLFSTSDSRERCINTCVSSMINSVHEVQNCTQGNTRHRHDDMLKLLANVAKLCGRGTSQASCHYLDRFCEQLRQLDIQNEALEEIKKAGAFFLAQQSNDLRDLLYAENLVSESGKSGTGRASLPGKYAIFVGYCWDETISEWITASPIARKTSKRRPLRSSSSRDLLQGIRPQTVVDSNSTSSTMPTNLTSSVAYLPSKQGSASSAIHETLARKKAATTNKLVSPSRRPGQVVIPDSYDRSQSALNSKRYIYTTKPKVVGFHGDSGLDKENRSPIVAQKRQSRDSREPLPVKRCIRLPWADDHSEDELGL